MYNCLLALSRGWASAPELQRAQLGTYGKALLQVISPTRRFSQQEGRTESCKGSNRALSILFKHPNPGRAQLLDFYP